MIKKAFLFLGFGLVVCIPLFLRFCSVNHFDIPLYYQEKAPVNVACDQVDAPYSVRDAGIINLMDSSQLILNDIQGKKVIAILKDETDHMQIMNEAVRMLDKFYDLNSVSGIFIFSDSNDYKKSGSIAGIMSGHQIMYGGVTRDKLQNFIDCKLFIPQNPVEGDTIWNGVLLDDLNRIRGYYDLQLVDETDRLSAEIKVLLREEKLKENEK